MIRKSLIVITTIFTVLICKGQENYIDKFDNLQDKRIIAVGESVHAINDFAEWNINFFKELVENDITTTFMLENDYSNSKNINRYIQGELNALDIDSLMETNLYGVWRSNAMKEFLEWSKNYNTGKADLEKINFYGFDSQYGFCAMKEISKYIDERHPEFKNQLSAKGLKLLSELSLEKNYNLKKLPKEDQYLMEETLEKMNQLFKKEIDSDEDVQMDLLALNHAWEFENANPLNFTNIRDRNMAVIFKEIFKNKTEPVFMWAHNGHISKSKKFFYKPIGYHLKKKYGSQYLAIGLDFYKKKNSSEYEDINKRKWIANKVDFKHDKNIKVIQTKDVGKLIIRGHGTSAGKTRIKNDNQFDYIVYFKEIKS